MNFVIFGYEVSISIKSAALGSRPDKWPLEARCKLAKRIDGEAMLQSGNTTKLPRIKACWRIGMVEGWDSIRLARTQFGLIDARDLVEMLFEQDGKGGIA